MVVKFADQQMDRYPQWPSRCAAHDLTPTWKRPGLRGLGYRCNQEMGLRVLARGYGRDPMRRLLLLRRGVAHRMRVRLTVRYRTFVRAARQVVFVVQSRVRDKPSVAGCICTLKDSTESRIKLCTQSARFRKAPS